jgi:hypothetical protein
MTSPALQAEQLAEADRENRVARTVQQVAPAAAIVTLVEYLASFLGIDLAPLDPESLAVPTYVSAALIGVGTWLFARRANQPPASPGDDNTNRSN